MDRPVGLDILPIHNEIRLGPHITSEAIYLLLAEVGGIIHPVRPKDPHIKVNRGAGLGIKIVIERGAIGPFKVMEDVSELAMDDIEVTTIGPIVPEVGGLQGSCTGVDEEQGVKLERPWRWCDEGGSSSIRRQVLHMEAEDEEKDEEGPQGSHS